MRSGSGNAHADHPYLEGGTPPHVCVCGSLILSVRDYHGPYGTPRHFLYHPHEPTFPGCSGRMSTGGIIFAAAFWHTTDGGALHGATIARLSALPALVHACGDQTVKRGHV